jgi:hypothetical protein
MNAEAITVNECNNNTANNLMYLQIKYDISFSPPVLLCVDLSEKLTFFFISLTNIEIIFITLFHFISPIMSHLTPKQKT